MPDNDSRPESPDHKGRTEPLGPAARGRPAPAARADDTGSFHPAEETVAAGAVCPLPADLIDHPRYRILASLGSGGMGTVYKAQHRLMDRVVALKIIKPELVGRPAMVERFHREVRAAARLAHPNIVAGYDADCAGNTHFLVMEFVEGVDLDRLLRERGALAVAQACAYARQTALGLQHAWERGMVHRDIKPHNLMLTPQGQVKILDFGLARFRSEVAAVEAPAASPARPKGTAYAYTGAGTADYIAPEEAIDAPHADIRADIYSLGCTLYRFLAGRVPFPEGDLLDKVKCHLERTPAPLAGLRPELPARLIGVVDRMMAKQPAQRFQTPAEVARALTPFTVGTPRPVLIVDDDPVTRQAMGLVFERRGYLVTFAAHGQEALERLRQGPPPSLILLDLLMPVMDGWQFLQRQKQDPELAGIPVIIISAADTDHARAIALGAADYLHKPIEPEELTAKVETHVAGQP
jgi:CheY-like chemotaxis protein